jgi:hypothetical protein
MQSAFERTDKGTAGARTVGAATREKDTVLCAPASWSVHKLQAAGCRLQPRKQSAARQDMHGSCIINVIDWCCTSSLDYLGLHHWCALGDCSLCAHSRMGGGTGGSSVSWQQTDEHARLESLILLHWCLLLMPSCCHILWLPAAAALSTRVGESPG